MPKVLTLGGDSTWALLAIIRSLGRKGIEVHCAWRRHHSPVDRSRYLTRTWDLPFYDPQTAGWKEALVDLVQRERFDLVIPCDDPALIPLQAHRSELTSNGNFYLLEDDAFDATFDKAKTYELAMTLGLPVPRQESVADPAEAAQVGERFGFPVVVKPASTFALPDVTARRRVRKAYDLKELRDHVAELANPDPVLLQENFIGAGVGLGVLAYRGELLVAFQYVRVHEPMEGGGSSYRRSVPLDTELRYAASKLLAALHYTGVMMIELKVDPGGGRWILVELNGRFWGALPLAVAAGVDFPYYLYQMLVDGRRDFPDSYRTGIYARNWSRDLRWFRANMTTDRGDPLLMGRPFWQVAAEAWNIVRLREHSDTFAVDDPAPALDELRELARDITRQVVGRTVHTQERLPWRRRVQRERLVMAVTTSRRLLFVCMGNVSRSPFAENYARRKAPPELEITSAGCLPLMGRPSPRAAILASAECDIDLCRHRSQVVTSELVEWADVVIVFDEAERSAIESTFPFAAQKTHYLGAADGMFPTQIADPQGRDLEFFRSTFARIRSSIDRLAAEAWAAGARSETRTTY